MEIRGLIGIPSLPTDSISKPSSTPSRRRRRLLVHKQKLRKLTNEFEARSLEVEGIMKDGAWGLQGLLESLYSQPQILFQSHPPHHTTTTSRRRRRRRLQLVHKHKRRKFRSLEDEDDDGGERFRFSIDLRFLQHNVPSFIQSLKHMEEEYIYEVFIMPDEDNDDESISSRSGTKSKLIALSDQFQQLKLVNCNPVALTCAKQLQPNPYAIIDVTSSSSFDEKPITIKFRRYGSGSEPV